MDIHHHLPAERAEVAALWSPLVGLGLLPVILAGLIVTRGKGSLAASNIAAIPLLAVIGLFFSARGLSGVHLSPIPFGWNDLSMPKLVMTFALEVLPWMLLLLVAPLKTPTGKSDRMMVLTCVFFLALLPLWRVGMYNDLMMRTSLPAFAVLAFHLLQKACQASVRWKKTALAILVAGSGGFILDLYRHIEFNGSGSNQIEFASPAKIPILPATPDLAGLLAQYLGSPEAGFFRILARPWPAVSDPVPYDQTAPPPGAIESQDRLQKSLRHRFEQGERSQEILREYATLCYYQRDLWDSLLALDTLVKLYPQDPNSRINLATLLSMSGIEAYRVRGLSELDAARRLVEDPAVFDRATETLRQSLKASQ
jgi:hypothetical protein